VRLRPEAMAEIPSALRNVEENRQAGRAGTTAGVRLTQSATGR